MRYLSGRWHDEICFHPMGGLLSSPDNHQRTIRPGTAWGADNGCFNAPERYTDDRYLRWLSRQPEGCLFATAPDVVGDHEATLEKSMRMLRRLREEGRPAAFCAQNGATPDTVPWNYLDALFIGGSTAWKLSGVVGDLIREAKKRGKHAHVGRVNSFQRLRAVHTLGADSVDGTFLAFGPDKNIGKLMGWLDRIYREPVLELR